MSLSSSLAVAADPIILVTPFVAADGHAMDLTERSTNGYATAAVAAQAFHDYEHTPGAVGWTLRVGDEIIGAAGLLPMWTGVMHAWMLTTPRLARYPRTVVITLTTQLRQVIEARGLWRVQATTAADFPPGQRFLSWLGFEVEGRLTGYGPDRKDHYMYALVIP